MIITLKAVVCGGAVAGRAVAVLALGENERGSTTRQDVTRQCCVLCFLKTTPLIPRAVG